MVKAISADEFESFDHSATPQRLILAEELEWFKTDAESAIARPNPSVRFAVPKVREDIIAPFSRRGARALSNRCPRLLKAFPR